MTSSSGPDRDSDFHRSGCLANGHACHDPVMEKFHPLRSRPVPDAADQVEDRIARRAVLLHRQGSTERACVIVCVSVVACMVVMSGG